MNQNNKIMKRDTDIEFKTAFVMILLSLNLMCFFGCSKDEFQAPVVKTVEVTDISFTEVKVVGEVVMEGEATVYSRGFCWSDNPTPTILDNISQVGFGLGQFDCSITNLTPDQTYYVTAYASSRIKTVYGEVMSFQTRYSDVPVLKTNKVTQIINSNVLCGSEIVFQGASEVLVSGIVCASTQNPTITSCDFLTKENIRLGNYSSILYGLSQGTTYFIRSYATNERGTSYGNEISFVLNAVNNCPDYVTDGAGRVYNVVSIGKKCWMAENLAYLPDVFPSEQGSVDIPYYYVYDYSGRSVSEAKVTENYQVYGVLYNWKAAVTACPVGWRLPKHSDWVELEAAADAQYNANSEIWNVFGWRGFDVGRNLKSTNDWEDGNGNDYVGFKGLPGGYRFEQGNFYRIGKDGYWWTSDHHLNLGLFRSLNDTSVQSKLFFYPKSAGFSVRCIKTYN